MSVVAQSHRDASERILAGLSISLFANLMFSTSDAIVKVLTVHYSVFQIVVTQALFALIPIAVMLHRTGGLHVLRVRHPKLVLLRGLLAGTGTVFGFFSFSQLPLAETYSIFFSTPIMVTLLSIPLLGERVGLHRWSAVIVGLIGVLVMVRPGFESLHVGHAAALMAAVIGSFTVLVMRRIAREEQHAVMVIAVVLGLIVVSLPGMILTFHMPSLHDMTLFAGAGLLMGSAQFFVVRALSFAPASAIAPMQYSQMLWAILYGFVLFGTTVDPMVILGATIVIGSGAYIMQRERRRAG
ncbi:DMT family transporter [Kaistia algarum]|uniref:DMT family transporter n=1 Tax=Kaistia algarum TaxID=2083279 RepID=UPI0014034CE5|nr:DMT family transporter [Kaistia algarum]MCX5516157.1 DMT family transporter [Kaistia algarum]